MPEHARALCRHLVVAEEMTIQVRRPGRFRAGIGVEVHDRDDAHVSLGPQGARVVRVGLSVKEDQLARLRPDDGAVLFQRLDANRLGIVARRRVRPRPPGDQ